MPIYMLGGGQGEPPFNRSFFNTTLGDIIERSGKDRSYKLTMFLVDGTQHEVCQIEELYDQYMTVRAFNEADSACELTVNIIPYGLIYRLELSPKEDEPNGRMGFHWTSTAQKTPKPARKTSK
jgi:hypothetical protein